MSKPTVLVVEDEAFMAKTICVRLQKLGYKVVGTVASGEEAVQVARKMCPDVVLMDIHLSGKMDGIEAAAQIRAARQVPIIYLTADADERVLQRAKLTTPYRYILKPFREQALHSSIEMALHHSEQQRRLRESEARYRDLVESIDEVVYAVDQSTAITYVSPAVEAFIGYYPAQVIGHHFGEFIHPEDLARLEDNFRHILSGQTMASEYRILTKSGQVRWMRTSSRPTVVNGQVNGVRGVLSDITEQVRAQETLQRQTIELEERVKELNCLFGISDLVQRPGISLPEILQGTVELVPPAWQYPEIACARIILGDQAFKTSDFRETSWAQASAILVHGEREGILQVCYLEARPQGDVGPFLEEERILLDGIAERLGRIIERTRMQEELGKYRDHLEGVVRVRTAELSAANEQLQREIAERWSIEEQIRRLGRLKEELLGPGGLEKKLKLISDEAISTFDADLCRIWIARPGDQCDAGCAHADATDETHACRHRDTCLHLVSSSGRYTHTDGRMHRRVPFGCYKVGRIAAGDTPKFLSTDVTHDPNIHDQEWARELGLVSFAGYRLLSADGEPIGVLALFGKHEISPDQDTLLEDLANTAAQVIQTTTAEAELRQYRDHLQELVIVRTEELIQTNEQLEREIADRTRAEETLKESEERFRSIFSQSPIAIELYGSTGLLIDANPACLDMFGVADIEAIRGFNLFEDPNVPQDVRQRSRAGQAIEFESEFDFDLVKSTGLYETTKSGRRYVDCLITPWIFSEGATSGFLVHVQDITARMRAEETLRESEELLRTLVESQGEGIGIVDEKERFVFANPAAERIFGVSPGDLVGKTLAEFMDSGQLALVHQETQQRKKGKRSTYEVSICRPDGRARDLLITATPQYDENGRFSGTFGGFRDITQRVRAEEALQRAHDELEVRVAERTTELAQANGSLRQRADELSALNALGHRVSGTLSLDQVVTASLEEVMGCVSPDLVMLYLRQEDELHLRGTRTTHPQAGQAEMNVHRVGECLCGLAAREGRAFYSSDIHADPLCTWQECKEAGIRSFAALPLLGAGETLGVLGIASTTVRRFDDQSAFLQALAGDIAMGLQNALLYHQVEHRAVDLEQEVVERTRAEDALRRHNRELELLDRSGRAFSSTLDINQVLASILDEVRQLFGVAACSIWLIEPESGDLVARQASGLGGEVVHGWRLAPGQGIVGWTAQTGESIIVPDTRLDDRYYPDVDHETGTELRSILCVPLRIQQGVIGAIEATDQNPNQFSSSDLVLLELLAMSAANAIENARLYEDLSLAHREWEEIFQAIGHPTLILDPEHNIVAANRATVEAAGEPEEALLGRKCYEAFHRTGCPSVGCPMEKLLTTAQVETVEMEMEVLGGVFLVSCTPVCDKDGHLRQVIHIATEITQRVRAEEALRRRNDELSILNAIATTIGQELDRDRLLDAALGRVLEITHLDTGWIQLAGEDARGMPQPVAARRGISKEAVGEFAACTGQVLIETVIRSREPTVITSASCDPPIGIEGETTWTVTAVPIQARDTVIGIFSVLSRGSHEMSSWEIQLLNAIGSQIGMAVENARLLEYASEIGVLREVDRMRSALIANVSHELRTPLGLIRVLSGALLMTDIDFDTETQHKFLRSIEEETHNLEVIVDNLLDLGRMESGRLQLDREPADLVQLIVKVTTSMAPQMERHRFEYDFPVDSLVATVDAERVEQMLRNLVSNAIKYSPEGGAITVCAYRDGSEALVAVSDKGIGIPVEEQEKIFERFYRVDNEVTRTTRGAGLGLSICRWIAKAHGGRIWIQSARGAGSTFSAVFPIEIPDSR